MTDQEITILLRNSEAFKKGFSDVVQKKILEKLPALSEAEKDNLIKTLDEEAKTLQKIKANAQVLMTEYQTGLKAIEKAGVNKFMTQVEDAERASVIPSLEQQITAL